MSAKAKEPNHQANSVKDPQTFANVTDMVRPIATFKKDDETINISKKKIKISTLKFFRIIQCPFTLPLGSELLCF